MKNHVVLKEFARGLIGFWLLATGSVCLALLINQLHDHPLPLIYATRQQRMEDAVAQVAASSPAPAPALTAAPVATDNPHVIGLEEFRGIVEGGKDMILDARPEIFHRLGHVPGAISLPRDDFEENYAKNKSLLESGKASVIAVYCSSESCEDSDMVASALVKLGYSHVLVFKGGWDEWSGAGLPQEGKQ